MEKERKVFYPNEIDEVRIIGEEAGGYEENIRTVYNKMGDNNVLVTSLGEMGKDSIRRVLYKITCLKNKAEVMRVYSENQGWADSIDFLYSKDVDEFKKDVEEAREELSDIVVVWKAATNVIKGEYLQKLGDKLVSVYLLLKYKWAETKPGSPEKSELWGCIVRSHGAIQDINKLSRKDLYTSSAKKEISELENVLETCNGYLNMINGVLF